jgi:hypothetical protein
MADIARALASIELVDDRERPVLVGSAWQEQPALLVFIRHFG